MKTSQLAAQLYSVRALLKTRESAIQTLERIRAIGYPAVQVSGYSYDVMPEEELLRECRRIGLTICATHDASLTILEDPAAVIARLDKLACKYTAYPHPAGIDFSSKEGIASFLHKLDAASKTLAAAGKVLCYHNHHMELRKLNGKIILDRIYSETSIQGELDTYWVQYGGGNPTTWVKRLHGRCPLIHLKDYIVNDQDAVTMTEIGNGVLEFPEIIKAADDSGCEWFIVEQDTCPGDPVDSLEISFRYLQTLTTD